MRDINTQNFIAGCSTCFTTPAECAVMGLGVVTGVRTVSITTPSASVHILKDTASSRIFLLAGADKEEICTTAADQTFDVNYATFNIEPINRLSPDTSIVLIKSVKTGKYFRICSTNCNGFNGSTPVIVCDYTKSEAKADVNAQFILTKT